MTRILVFSAAAALSIVQCSALFAQHAQAIQGQPAMGAAPGHAHVGGEVAVGGYGAIDGEYVGDGYGAYPRWNRFYDRHIHPRGFWPPYSAAPWHGHYYNTEYGRPVSLVVPPTAATQTTWGWGVGNVDTVPIYSQYGRQYPGRGPFGNGQNAQFRPTPQWPSHTDQFGVYPVRAPW